MKDTYVPGHDPGHMQTKHIYRSPHSLLLGITQVQLQAQVSVEKSFKADDHAPGLISHDSPLRSITNATQSQRHREFLVFLGDVGVGGIVGGGGVGGQVAPVFIHPHPHFRLLSDEGFELIPAMLRDGLEVVGFRDGDGFEEMHGIPAVWQGNGDGGDQWTLGAQRQGGVGERDAGFSAETVDDGGALLWRHV